MLLNHAIYITNTNSQTVQYIPFTIWYGFLGPDTFRYSKVFEVLYTCWIDYGIIVIGTRYHRNVCPVLHKSFQNTSIPPPPLRPVPFKRGSSIHPPSDQSPPKGGSSMHLPPASPLQKGEQYSSPSGQSPSKRSCVRNKVIMQH